MKIAGIQLDIAWENPEENFRRADSLAREALLQGARIIVLPEMFATGFSMNVSSLSAAAPRIKGFLQSLARELSIIVVGGVAEALPDDPLGRGCNLALVFGPDGGLISRYQKIHPFSYGHEQKYYAGGTSLGAFVADDLRITPFVCYDLRFPEIFRAAADRSDLMLVIANWPAARFHAWRTLLMARALDCQCFVLGVNRVGQGGGLDYPGGTMLVDPMGAIIQEAAPGQGFVLGNVSPEDVTAVRDRFSFLKDRKPDVYRRL